MRKKQFLTETQAKLDNYREILNTRILSRLDYHALQQSESYKNLDQKVQDLAVALSEGRNTYEEVLATHTTDIKAHIDRRFNDKADKEAKFRHQQQFKDSLFYPEINARQDNIAISHQGTCRWIFGPTEAGNESESVGTDSDTFSEDGNVEEITDQPWSNFKDWLEADSSDPYWLSGKPGSGKSTLMKYISTEFRSYCQSHDTLSGWADAVTCSFFFWNLGSSLQKSYIGLLRSLLHQIAEQQPGMIDLMSKSTQSGSGEPYGSSSVHTWTEQRLDDALARFLEAKRPAMRICMFIDGLDEFVGDEDRLIDTIHVLSHASGTKVCASSRPEQIFRQGFSASPQLKLQDLIFPDIRKATVERLLPALKAHVSCAEWELDRLVNDVVQKSQGIFLWADLMTKDLKRGARNADRFEELEQRLEHTPDTIDGLYEHMLGRLDKHYLRDAAGYFHHLLMFQEIFNQNLHSATILAPNLLAFACIQENVLDDRLYQHLDSLQDPKLQEWCSRTESRILTRCAGLVEIDEHALPSLPYRGAKYAPKPFVREVKFIHKSAADYLKNQKIFYEDSNWQWTGRFSVVRAQIAIAGLTPIFISKPGLSDLDENLFRINRQFVAELMEASYAEAECCQEIRNASIQIVDELYNVLCYLDTKSDGLSSYAPRRLRATGDGDDLPLEGRLGFATQYGRHEYVAQYRSSNNPSPGDVERFVSCAISGLAWQSCLQILVQQNCTLTRKGLLRILLEYLPLSTDPYMMVPYDYRIKIDQESKWAAFLTTSIRLLDMEMKSKMNPQHRLQIIKMWSDVVKTFFSHDAIADPNIVILFKCNHPRDRRYVKFEESLLSYLERVTTGCKDPVAKIPMMELEDLVRSHGGTSFRRSCSYLGRTMRDIMLTDEQSDRVLKYIPPKYPLSPLSPRRRTTAKSPTQSELEQAAEFVPRFERFCSLYKIANQD